MSLHPLKYVLYFVAIGWILTSAVSAQQSSNEFDELRTVAEASEFTATSSSADVEAFLLRCDEMAPHVTTTEFGKTAEGRPMTAAIVSQRPYRLGESDERLIALVIANIHSGECDGKEALLQLLRELTLDAEHRWLQNMVVILVPNYNADGNDRVGAANRPGQVGPEAGMGMRENAQHLDLNRDFIKLDSPEARNLVGLIDTINPHLFIDCHTTNGSRHRYGLTYEVPHNPSASERLRQYLTQRVMPAITTEMEDRGWLTFYYGTPDRENRKWETYGFEPRYSTEYVGLRGRLSILSESYSYISYRERIEVTYAFVSECLQYLHAHETEAKALLNEVAEELVGDRARTEQILIALEAQQSPAEGTYTLKAFRGTEPHDYEVELWNQYTPTETAALPFAYLIPGDLSRVADRLRMHGIAIEELLEPVALELQVETVRSIRRAAQPFQRHHMVQLDTAQHTAVREVPAGTFVVRTAQPLGRLAGYLLEARSNDGLVTWNFFDDQLSEGGEFPIGRCLEAIPLPTRAVDAIVPREQITLEMIDGPGNLIDSLPKQVSFYPGSSNYLLDQWGRPTLVDPASGSFLRGALGGRGAQSRELALLQTALGERSDRAAVLLAGERIASLDGSLAVLRQQQDAILIEPERDRSLVLGWPDSPAEVISFSPNSRYCLFVRNRTLCAVDRQTWQVRELGVPRHQKELVGILDWVYQEELYGRGNYFGYWISPDSSQVAFLALDETEVPTIPIVDHLLWQAQSTPQNYPNAGDPLPKVSLLKASLESVQPSQAVVFDEAHPFDLISRVSWSRDGKRLFVQTQNRQQTYLDLWSVDRAASAAAHLMRDSTPAWIESLAAPCDLPDGSFIWLSPRDGFQHLYRYASDGKPMERLTEGPWQVLELYGADSDAQWVYFRANRFDPLGGQVFRLHLASSQIELLTPDPGTHDAEFSPDWDYFIDQCSTMTETPSSVLRRANGDWVRDLNVGHDDRVAYLQIQAPRAVQVPLKDGQVLDGQLILPPRFDTNAKYPVIVHVYSGPATPRVRDAFGGKWYLFHQMLAQRGYVIWLCDNRTSSLRSAASVWPLHHELGSLELADIERGLDWLQSQGWVDADRIGIWGWSYGGYMTAYAMTHSDRFKVGISGAPVTDWRNYDAIYTERFMGLPQDNPDGYDRSSALAAAGNLQGRLLLIHGGVDDNVHLGNTLKFAHALQGAGKTFQLQIYPASQHAVVDADRAMHLKKTMLEFFLENL